MSTKNYIWKLWSALTVLAVLIPATLFGLAPIAQAVSLFWRQTSQGDFQAGTLNHVDVTSSGNVLLSATPADYSQTSSNSNSNNIYGTTYVGQTFTPATSGLLTRVTIRVRKYGSPQALVVELRNIAGTVPNETPGTTIYATAQVAAANITTGSYNNYDFDFAAPYNVTASTRYALVIHQYSNGGDNTTNYYRVNYQNSNVYSNGRYCTSTDGSSWTGTSNDLYFYTYIGGLDYYFSGNLTSSFFPAPANLISWGNLSWNETVPTGTDIQFQIATSPDNVTWTAYVGYDGTAGTYYTTNTGTPIVTVSGHSSDRYIKYRAYLTGNGLVTPTLADVTITYNVPPDVPTLSSPVNGSGTYLPRPTFAWSDVSAATYYHLQVDNNSDFSSPAINQTNLTTSSFTPGSDLAPDTYYWRVQACDAAGCSAYTTPAWSLTIYNTKATIGDLVWRDTNGNGSDDGGEPGINNVAMTLLQNGSELAHTTTDSTGRYSFTNLVAPIPVTARDEFETVAYNNNDGTINWTGNWQETDDDNNANGGDIRILSGQLRIGNNNGGNLPSISRQANLSGYTNAVLSFDYTIGSQVDLSDAIAVQVSGNGGTSWTTLETFTNMTPGSDTRTYDISAYNAANTTIRFIITSGYESYSAEYFYVDNLQIWAENQPLGAYTVRVDDSNFTAGGPLAGLTLTSEPASPAAVQVTVGQNLDTVDFGYGPFALISGMLFQDNNRNGLHEITETTGIPNTTVWLYTDINGNGLIDSGDSMLRTAVTDSSGHYTLRGVPTSMSNYTVWANETDPNLPPAFRPTTPNPVAVTGVTAVGTYTAPDIGFNAPPLKIKQLYLHRQPNNLWLDRTAPTLPGGDNFTSTQTWVLTPTLADRLVLVPGATMTVTVHIDIAQDNRNLDVRLSSTNFPGYFFNYTYNATGGEQILVLTRTLPITMTPFNVGDQIYLSFVKSGGGSTPWQVYQDYSSIELPTYSYINTFGAGAYDAAYPGGAMASTFIQGHTAYLRVTASDPFGAYDISGATLNVPGVVTNAAMSLVGGSALTRTYETAIPNLLNNIYNYTITTTEGAEGQVWAVDSGAFEAIVSNLGNSSKTVDRATASPNDPLIYTITLSNTGGLAATVRMTDTLPPNVTYTNNLSYTGGTTVTYSAGLNAVLAEAYIRPNRQVTVTYRVTVNQPLDNGAIIANNVTINDGFSRFETTPPAETTITSAPILSTSTKTVDQATTRPGQLLEYTIKLTNTGNMNAYISAADPFLDPIPADTSFYGGLYASAGIISFNGGFNQIEWHGAVPANSAVTLRYRVRVNFPLDNGAVITNTALINEGVGFPSPQIYTRAITTTVQAAPNLASHSTKLVDRLMAAPGDPLAYTIRLQNDGDMNAVGVVMTDTLPANTTWGGDAFLWATSGTIITGTGVFTWQGDINAGQNTQIFFRAIVNTPLPNYTQIVNVAHVSDAGNDFTPLHLSANTTVQSAPNLNTSAKTVNATTAVPGSPLTYTIRLVNTGNAVAAASLVDTLPSELFTPTLLSVSSGQAQVVGASQITWTGQVTPGLPVTITFRANLLPALDNNTIVRNIALVNDGVNAEFSLYPPAETTIRSTPQLTTSLKTVDRATARPGEVLIYTITLTNTGNMVANTLVRDVLPGNVTFNGGLSASPGAPLPSYSLVDNLISWQGEVVPGAPITVSYQVLLNTPLNNGLVIQNNAEINDGVHTAYITTPPAQTTISSAPVLSTSTKSVNLSNAGPDDSLHYTIHLVNTGDMIASGVILSDTIPAEVTFANGPYVTGGVPGSYIGPQRRVYWNGSVAPGSDVIVEYYVTVNNPLDNGTAITNTATISDGYRTTLDTNVVTTTVTAAPDLSGSSKTVDQGTANPGARLHYTITLNNSGNMNAANVTVVDTLPPLYATLVATPSGAIYNATAGTLTWSGLTVNRNLPLTLNFDMDLAGTIPNGTRIVNTATITDGFAGHTGLTRQATTIIGSAPNLQTSSKEVDLANAAPNDLLVYTITLRNTGNATATGARITDTLPVNLTWNSWVAQNGAVVNGNLITWTGNVAPNVNQVIAFRARVRTPLDNNTTILNSATVNDGFNPPLSIGPAQTTIHSAPDVSTSSKAVDLTTAAPGQQLVYTLTVRNTGNMVAHSAEVLDIMPAHGSYVANSVAVVSGGGQAVYQAAPYNRIRWTGDITPTTNVVITFRVLVDSPLDNGTQIVNFATVDDRFISPPSDTNQVVTTIGAAPDMRGSSKTVSRTTASPDDQVNYTITLLNNGSMTANARMDDVLPANVSYLSGPAITGGGSGGYDVGSRRIYWNGQVMPNQTVTIIYYVTVNNPLDNGTAITNTATISDGYRTTLDTNVVTTTVTAAPDLSGSSKTVDQGTANPGARLHYTITLNNSGNMNAANVTVVDTLPPLYATLVATPSGAIYNATAGTLTWSGLTVNRNLPLTLNFDMDLAGTIPNGTRIVNTATITDGFAGHTGLTRQATTIIGSAPNLQTSSKEVDLANAAPNDLLVYTITLRNTGNATATGARITDTLPVNLTWNSWVAQNGAVVNGNLITWTGNVAPNVNQVIAFRARVRTPLDNNTTILNSATVNDGFNPPLSIGPAQTTIHSAPDVSTSSKAVDLTTAAPGQQLVYTLTVRNTGNMVAHSAEVLDIMPAHGSYVANSVAVVSGGGQAVYQAAPYNRIRWTGDITPTTNVVITFRVLVDSPLDNGTQIVNFATVDDRFISPPSDTNQVVTTIGAAPDMRGSSKTVSRTTASPDDQVNYTITLLNNGSMTANARMDDVLPANVSYLSGPAITGGGSGGYDVGSRRIYWNGQVMPNQTVTIIYYVTVNNPLDNGTAITNTATISDGYRTTLDTNVVTTTVTAAPDLSGSSKTVDQGTANPGARLHYTITLNNSGNMNATNVTVVDTLPPLYATLVATPSGAIYNATAGTLTWSGLTVNRNLPLTLNFDMDLAGTIPNGTRIVNTATITDGFAGHTGLTRQATTIIGSAPNLQTSSKEVDLANAAPNDLLVYTITLRNTGNATAVGARITDTLPANLTWNSWIAQNGAVVNGNLITWTGNVAPNVNQVIAFRARVRTPLDNNTTILNSATVNDGFNPPLSIGPAQTTIHSAPDVSTSSKAVDLTTAAPGQQLVYTLTVRNTGNMVAHSAVVLDEIPAYTTYIDPSATATSGSVQYQTAYDRIRWTGEVTPGTNVIITFRVRVASPLNNGLLIQNFANVNDGVNTFDTNTVSTTIQATPNLSTSAKTVDLAEASPGDLLHYTITLTNTGDMMANTNVTDRLPPQVAYVGGPTVQPPVGTAIWDSVNRRILWSGSVAPGTNVTIDYYVTVNSPLNDGSVITNTATIADGVHPAFETGATQTTVHSQPDLSGSTKTVNRITAAPGSVIIYTITLHNSGTMIAHNTVLTDILPSNTQWDSWVTQNSTIRNGNAITWTGNVAPGVDQVIAYQVRLNGGLAPGDRIENLATINDNQGQVFDIGPAVTTIGREIGLYLTDGRDTILPGELITYTIAVSSTEPPGSGYLRVRIPTGTTLQGYNADYCSPQGNYLRCDVIGSQPDFYQQFYMTVQLPTIMDNGTIISTTADVAAGTQTNNATDTDFIVSSPNLTTSVKTVSNPGAGQGQLITYRIVLTNTGNMHAHYAGITDTLPAELVYQGKLSASGGTPDFNNGEIHWNGEVLVGAPVTISYTAQVSDTVPDGAEVTNIALIRDDLDNNFERSATIAVNREAPPASGQIFLPIILSGNSAPAPTGPDIELTIRNCGDTLALGYFWVDLYINPDQSHDWPPRLDYTYPLYGQGAGFKVSAVGAQQSLTLRLADADPLYKNVPATLNGSLRLYAQVDSVKEVPEQGQPYKCPNHSMVCEGDNGETNNFAGSNGTICGNSTPGKPDLIVESIRVVNVSGQVAPVSIAPMPEGVKPAPPRP